MTEMAAQIQGPPGPPGRGRPGRPGSPGPQGRPGISIFRHYSRLSRAQWSSSLFFRLKRRWRH